MIMTSHETMRTPSTVQTPLAVELMGFDHHTLREFTESDIQQFIRQVYKGTILREGPVTETPPLLKVVLKHHQKRMLHEMLQKESLDCRFSERLNALCLIDSPGAGKSVEVLSLICHKPLVPTLNVNKLRVRCSNFCGYHYTPAVEFRSNLIVVPHTIFDQWHSYIKRWVHLPFIAISNTTHIQKLDVQALTLDTAPAIILVKSTLYNQFIARVHSGYTVSETVQKRRLDDAQKNIQLYKKLKPLITQLYENSRKRQHVVDMFTKLRELSQICSEPEFETLSHTFKEDYSYLMNNCLHYTGPMFQRVIFDEPGSLESDAPFIKSYAKFHWFITSDFEKLLYPSQMKSTGFIQNYFRSWNFPRSLNMHAISQLLLKNFDDFVDESMCIPLPVSEKIVYSCTSHEKLVHTQTSCAVQNALDKQDFEAVAHLVQCKIGNIENVSDAVLSKLVQELKKVEKMKEGAEVQLQNLETDLRQCLTQTDIYDLSPSFCESLHLKHQSLHCLQDTIEKYTTQLNALQSKIDSVQYRISKEADKICPICQEIVSYDTITPCCKQVFCFKCLVKSLSYSQACPMCREQLSPSTIILMSPFDSTTSTSKMSRIQKKVDYLVETILNTPEGKFILYVELEKTFRELKTALNSKNITYSKICGNVRRISKLVSEFCSGDLQVIILKPSYLATGVNLEACTDLIFCDPVIQTRKREIISKAQRHGRTCRLRIRYMCTVKEYYESLGSCSMASSV